MASQINFQLEEIERISKLEEFTQNEISFVVELSKTKNEIIYAKCLELSINSFNNSKNVINTHRCTTQEERLHGTIKYLKEIVLGLLFTIACKLDASTLADFMSARIPDIKTNILKEFNEDDELAIKIFKLTDLICELVPLVRI